MVVTSYIRVSGGLNCRFVESSKGRSIEVLNPCHDPHWLIARGKGEHGGRRLWSDELGPQTLAWDQGCVRCEFRRRVDELGVGVSNFFVDEGIIDFQILATSEMYREFLDWMKHSGYDYQILSAITSRKSNGTNGLTRKQLQSLRVALRDGFYEYPRKTDLKRLGQVLGCSPSTLCEMLRRGEKAVLNNYLDEHVNK